MVAALMLPDDFDVALMRVWLGLKRSLTDMFLMACLLRVRMLLTMFVGQSARVLVVPGAPCLAPPDCCYLTCVVV